MPKIKDGFEVAKVVLDGDTKATLTDVRNRDLVLELGAGCCSTSFFEERSLETLRGLVGQTLVELEQVEFKDATPECLYQAIVSPHVLKITTKSGHETVDWRNESNGYYDGYLMVHFDGFDPVVAVGDHDAF